MIEFSVRGVPKGQPRPRAFTRVIGGKPVARVFEAGTAERWKADIVAAGAAVRPTTPIEYPVSVAAVFFLPRPRRLMRKGDLDGPVPATGAPDIDNLLKAVMDALTNDGWWRDDSLVIYVCASKYYHEKTGHPGARISVVPITIALTRP